MSRSSYSGLVAAVVLLLLPGSALAHPFEASRTRAVAIGWEIAPLSPTSKWIRVTNSDAANHIRLLSVHGLGFDIKAITAVRASGAVLPDCRVSTEATTFDYLYCTGDLPPDSTLFMNVTTAGTGNNYEIAASEAFDPKSLSYIPDMLIDPLLTSTAKFESQGTTTRAQVTFSGGDNAFDEVEILPYQTAITKVVSMTPKTTTCDVVGNGLDCIVALPAHATGTIVFDTAQPTGTPSADVVLSGDVGVSDSFVQQTVGQAPKYDLSVSAPKSVTYKRGQRLGAHTLMFTVSNGASAAIASGAAAVTVKTSAKLGATASCAPRTIGALDPGKSATCTVSFKPGSAKAKAGTVTLSVACSAAAETSCRNNSAHAAIVVK